VNALNEEAVNRIMELYGPEAWVRTVRLEYESARYFNRIRNLVEQDRMGEVVFAVERPNGKFVAVRRDEYPEGIYRIPTGGISHGEDIIEAVKREVLEELGLDVRIERFIGLYRIMICKGKDHVWFYSFFFHVKETGGKLLKDATDDEVAEVMEADAGELEMLSKRLLNIEHGWKDWGMFRHLSTSAISAYAGSLGKA
jgi:8-oxo-dGTP diphosphatase